MQFQTQRRLSPGISRPMMQQMPMQMPMTMRQSPLARPQLNVSRPGAIRPNTSSVGRLPGNINVNVNQPRSPITTFGPAGNNKMDINLNINVNQDGTVSASTTQGMPMGPMVGGFGVPRSPVMGPGPKPMPQMMPLGYSMGPSAIPYASFNPMGSSMIRGAPYGMPFLPPRYPQPSYTGYRQLDPSSVSSSFPRYPNDGPTSRSLPKIDTNIEQQKVHCVICQTDYLTKDKDQHVKRHQRQPQNNQKIRKLVKEYKEEYTGPQTRPIVQPEEYNIQYNPNSFILEQQTKYSTPAVVPPPPPPARTSFAIGTSDPPNTSYNQPQPSPIRNTVYQPENVRLTQNNEQITPMDPTQYQGGRTIRQSQQSQFNQPSLIQNNPPVTDTRFSRNTFISDEPSPIVQPPSMLYGRETIQSQEFRGSQMPQSMRVGATGPATGQGQGLEYQSSMPTPNPIPQTNTLPKRDTVMSQDFRNSQVPPTQTTPGSPYLSVAQKIATNHQSVMSPIREQSQNRQTASQQFNEDPSRNTLSPQPQPQPQLSTPSRPVSSQLNSNNTVLQANQPRSTYIDPLGLNDYKESLPVIGSQSGRAVNSDASLLDEFAYGNASPDTKIIPRQARNTMNQDIPISAIIQDKFGK